MKMPFVRAHVRNARRSGLTLIEVVVALGMMAAGVMVAVAFQTSSIRTNTNSDLSQKLTRLVSTELDYWRQTVVVLGEDDDTADLFADEDSEGAAGGSFERPCVTTVPDGFDQELCTVDVDVCHINYGRPTTLDCTTGPAALFRVTVTAQGPRGDTLSLMGYSTGLFVSGRLGGTP